MPEMTGAEILVTVLKNLDLDKMFGAGGSEHMPWIDAAGRLYDGYWYSHCHHEEPAAYMGLHYTWLTGKPAIITGTEGAGVSNMLNPMFVAFRDCAPVIMLVCYNYNPIWRHGAKSFEQDRCFKPVTKWCANCEKVEEIPQYVNLAYKMASTPPTGPVYLGLREDLLFQRADVSTWRGWPVETSLTKVIPTSTLIPPDRTTVRKLANLLVEADFPSILVGHRTYFGTSDAYKEVGELMNLLGAPGAASRGGPQGPPVGEENPYWMGGVNHPASIQVFSSQSDLLLAINENFNDFTTRTYQGRGAGPWGVFPERITQVDDRFDKIATTYPIECSVVGTLKPTLRLLIEEIKALKPPSESVKIDRAAKIKAIKDSLEKTVNEYWEKVKDAVPIHPLALAKAMDAVLPRDAWIFNGAGASTGGWFTLGFKDKEPKTRHSGTTSLGHSWSACMAARLVLGPERTIVNGCGDAEFWWSMGLNEMETATRHNLPFLTILWSNNCYGNQAYAMQRRYPHHDDEKLNWAWYKNPDFASIAKVYGMYGERVSKPEQLKPAIERGLKAGKTTGAFLMVDLDETVLQPPPELSAMARREQMKPK